MQLGPGEHNVQNFCGGMSIESHATMLTKASIYRLTLPVADQSRFRKAKVPLYKNEYKSGLNRPWSERAVCWKRQEVSDNVGMKLPGTSCIDFKIQLSGPLA